MKFLLKLSVASLLLLAVYSSTAIPEAYARSTVRVHSYVSKSGRYVNSYVRTKKNNTKLDNFSTKGNINPYTGKNGTRKAFK